MIYCTQELGTEVLNRYNKKKNKTATKQLRKNNTMEAIKERRAIVLQDTIEYYSQDPEGRRCKDGFVCRYSPKTVGKEATSQGCAVGRLLSPNLREYLDKEYEGTGVSNDQLFYALPQAIQDLGQLFLGRLQFLHDIDEYWNSEGLTEEGKEYVQLIEKNFCV